jgi:hypothetical protein
MEMNEVTAKRIYDTERIMKIIAYDGLDEHTGLIEEALQYFLLDVLSDSDFERVMKEMIK